MRAGIGSRECALTVSCRFRCSLFLSLPLFCFLLSLLPVFSYMEQHECSYDIKSLHRKKLKRENEEIRAAKILKL